MGKKIITVTGLLVGLYIAAAYGTGLGTSMKAAGGVYAQGVKTLQGR